VGGVAKCGILPQIHVILFTPFFSANLLKNKEIALRGGEKIQEKWAWQEKMEILRKAA
jgi:hypothetical protein